MRLFQMIFRHFISTVFWAAVSLIGMTAVGLASTGGTANTCPWTKDIHITMGAQSLTLSQDIFSAKTIPISIKGFDVIPDVNKLKLLIIDPYRDMWQASLTLLSSTPRCVAYYAGQPYLVSSPFLDGRR